MRIRILSEVDFVMEDVTEPVLIIARDRSLMIEPGEGGLHFFSEGLNRLLKRGEGVELINRKEDEEEF